MLKQLPPPILGILTFVLLAMNTLFFAILLIVVIPFKVAIPSGKFKRLSYETMEWLVRIWIDGNTFIFRHTQRTTWDVAGASTDLKPDDWYLIISNHRSWADIFVLFTIFNRKTPFVRFFLKEELKWFPLLGFVWWGLDYPFMKRYSKTYLQKHPEKRGEDLETTRQACRKFRRIPVAIINFLEGTRFTQAKHDRQNSPYRHLLVPKAGGIAFALSAMGERFSEILNVTIVYPVRSFRFWHMLSGKLPRIVARVERLAIPEEALTKDYLADEEFRLRFQAWVNHVWQQKDQLIEDLTIKFG